MKKPTPFKSGGEVVASVWDTGFGIELHGGQLYTDDTAKLITWLHAAIKFVDWKTGRPRKRRQCGLMQTKKKNTNAVSDFFDWRYFVTAKGECKLQHRRNLCTRDEIPQWETVPIVHEAQDTRENRSKALVRDLQRERARLEQSLEWANRQANNYLAEVSKLKKHISQMSCCCAGCTKHNLALDSGNGEKIGDEL
jgi:hypothetical protein